MATSALSSALRAALPALAGVEARAVTLEPVTGGDVNEAYRVRTPGFDAFVKTRHDAPAGSFEAEAAGLGLLGRAVRTPRVLAASRTPPFLALEPLAMSLRGDDAALGHAIARVHDARVRREELPRTVWIGPLALPNVVDGAPASFFRLRVAPLLEAAPAGLDLDPALVAALERTFDERLSGRPQDRLLHGDLWSGNAAFTNGEPVLFDPCVGAGDPEADLAMMDLFGGFSPRVWSAYRSVHPAAAGEAERRPCYALFPLLVHHALFGGGYTGRCRALVRELARGA
jgi:protein-ribulosamine 3-kinase